MTQMAWILLVITSLVVGPVYPSGWMNDWDQAGSATCTSPTSFISKMSSYHNNHREDRRFKVECRGLPISVASPSCRWTGYINTYDQEMDYKCPDMGWVAGIWSDHKSRFEDRLFKLYCCKGSGYVAYFCESSGYVNGWDAPFTYTMPSGRVMVGMESKHDDDYEDRRFKFETCKMVKIA